MPQRDLTNVSLDLLKTLAVFADTGRVEETARRRGVTQAAVSLQLRRLEAEVGEPLFQARGRRKVLTDFARDLCRLIAPPLRELDRKLAEVSRFLPEDAERVWRIGCPPAVMGRVIDLLRLPGRREFRVLSVDELVAQLEDDGVDLAILPTGRARGGDFRQPLFSEARRFFASEMPPHAPRTLQEWTDLLKTRLKTPVSGAAADRELFEVLVERLKADGEPSWGDLADDWHAVARLVRARGSWCLAPAGFEFSTSEWEIPEALLPRETFEVVARSDRQSVASSIGSGAVSS